MPSDLTPETLADFEDPLVQTVYAILCDTAPPPAEEHWEGWVSRRIVTEIARAVLEARERPLLTLYDAMGIAEEGFRQWAAKPHNRKWARKIDGTPIPNDLPIVIAEAFVAAYHAARREGEEGSDG